MRVSIPLCVLAMFALALADDVVPETQPNQTMSPEQALAGPLMAIAAQRQWSKKYGDMLLTIQANSAWLQVAQQYMKMLDMEANLNHILEEDDDEDEVVSSVPSTESGYDDLERGTERMFLFAMKHYFIQSGNKLNDAQEAHYQNKVLLYILQTMAGANPTVSSLLYLIYYRESIRVLSTAATLQRYDALNQWLYYEILETDEFENSRVVLPQTFASALNKMSFTHTGLHVQEATYDLQIMYIDYYVAMMLGGAPAHNNNAAASSFLEEEMTAEPNKPFFSPMMMGPQYFSYITQYMKFASTMFNVQAAQGFHMGAQINADPKGTNAKHAVEIKRYALHAMYQWAYMNIQVAMIDMWSMFAGVPHHAAAANANAFVQTGAEATPAQA